MTDFLTSLVQRSFGTVGAIRPRVASLFELVGKDGASSVDAAEPRDREPVMEDSPGPDAREKPIERHPAVASPESMEGLEAARIVNGASTPFAARLPPDVPEDRSRRVPFDRSVVAENMLPVSGRDDRRDSTSRERRQRGSDRTTTSRAARSEREARASGDGPASQSVASPAPSRTLENDERGLLVAPGISAEVAADMQRSVSASDTRGGKRFTDAVVSPPADPRAQTEPDIHVTIGRIEVRATTDVNAPARQRPASPVMGLDEYLRLRVRRGGP